MIKAYAQTTVTANLTANATYHWSDESIWNPRSPMPGDDVVIRSFSTEAVLILSADTLYDTGADNTKERDVHSKERAVHIGNLTAATIVIPTTTIASLTVILQISSVYQKTPYGTCKETTKETTTQGSASSNSAIAVSFSDWVSPKFQISSPLNVTGGVNISVGTLEVSGAAGVLSVGGNLTMDVGVRMMMSDGHVVVGDSISCANDSVIFGNGSISATTVSNFPVLFYFRFFFCSIETILKL